MEEEEKFRIKTLLALERLEHEMKLIVTHLADLTRRQARESVLKQLRFYLLLSLPLISAIGGLIIGLLLK